MDTSLLMWAKGTGLEWATIIMLLGLTVRVVQILILGRASDLSEARNLSVMSAGMKAVGRRFMPPQGMFEKGLFVYVSGYIFHIGIFIVLFFFIPHIEMIEGALGISWPGFYTSFVDAVTVITLLTLVVIVINRTRNPVQKLLSTAEDYITWLLTFLPLLTGYLAYHHMFLEYNLMLAVHIISVEALMVAVPFSKLSHMVTLFLARWYNGAIAGRKGVQS
jgi:nitrate reductase gamma subunit